MALDDQDNIKPVFDAARDCFHASNAKLDQGFVRQIYTSSMTRPGPLSEMQKLMGADTGPKDSATLQTSVTICQPVDPATQDTIGALIRQNGPGFQP